MSLLSRLPLACTGHVLVDLPLFMGPVVLLAGWLLLATRRARKREACDRTPTPETQEHLVKDNLIGLQT